MADEFDEPSGKEDLPTQPVSFCPESEPEPEPEPEYCTCLDRAFVQLEVREAVKSKRHVITIFEEDRRRAAFFDYSAAGAKYTGSEFEFLLNIDSVTYRRDKYETDAMIARLTDKMKQPNAAQRARVDPLNAPGHWDFFLSHGQAVAGDQVARLCLLLQEKGFTVWYDNDRLDRSTAAMVEGVQNCDNFVLFLSGDSAAGSR